MFFEFCTRAFYRKAILRRTNKKAGMKPASIKEIAD